MNIENLSSSFDLLATIGGVIVGLSTFVFGWIIKLLKSQAKVKDELSDKIQETKEIVMGHEKDVEYLKEGHSGFSGKIESLASEMNDVKLSLKENSVILGSMVERNKEVQSRIKTVDGKLDTLIVGFAENRRKP